MNSIVIYCDGACSNNQSRNNKGGWGVILEYNGVEKEIFGGEKNTSNQKMELKACIEALKIIKNKELEIMIYSDSAYLVNCFKQKWYVRWQANGWKNAKKKPVENQELWRELLNLTSNLNVSFIKVKGHSGNEKNERADQLANRGMDQLDKL